MVLFLEYLLPIYLNVRELITQHHHQDFSMDDRQHSRPKYDSLNKRISYNWPPITKTISNPSDIFSTDLTSRPQCRTGI